MAKPAADDVDFDAGLKQVNRAAMSEGVRADLAADLRVVQVGRVSANDLVDTEAGQGPPLGAEYRCLRRPR